MIKEFSERDWKYLRSSQAELLSSLCERINHRAMEILQSGETSAYDKYKALYQHVIDSDDLVARCFDDWRRSTIRLKVVMLHQNGLLTEEHLRHLSIETRNLLASVPKVNDKK